MEEEYILKYTGEETDALLKHTESLKDQTTAEDGETVQVYDESGIPHKIAKTELLNKAILATTSIQDISKFIAINEAGNAVGIMTLEQITEVFRKEFAKFPSSSETSAVVAVNKKGDALGLMSNEKLAQVVGGLLSALIPKGYAKGDANLILLPGIYDFHKDDYPFSNIPLNFGTLIVYSGNSDRHFITQIASSISSSEVYSRTSTEGGESWGPWLKLN